MNTLLKTAVVALSCLFLLPSSALAEKEIKWPKRLVMAVSMGGGPGYLINASIAQFIEKNTPIERVIMQPMGGPSVWLPRMAKGQVDLAQHNGPDIVDAMFARNSYEGTDPAVFVRTLIPGSMAHFIVHATPDSGIRTIADLKGKVVYTKDPGNPMFEELTNLLLSTEGLTQKDLKASMIRVNVGETTGALIEGRADASISPSQASMVMEIRQAKGECLTIGLTDEEAAKIKDKIPDGYFLMDLPANWEAVKNTEPMKNVLTFKNNLYCSSKMDPEVVYELSKLLIERRSEWDHVSAKAKQWGHVTDDTPPLHEGAMRFYREHGDLTPENEARMNKILADLPK